MAASRALSVSIRVISPVRPFGLGGGLLGLALQAVVFNGQLVQQAAGSRLAPCSRRGPSAASAAMALACRLGGLGGGSLDGLGDLGGLGVAAFEKALSGFAPAGEHHRALHFADLGRRSRL